MRNPKEDKKEKYLHFVERKNRGVWGRKSSASLLI
jgi:hypothetical protein